MWTHPLTIALVAGLVAGVSSTLLTIFLTPRLQHHFWKLQRREELRLAAINEDKSTWIVRMLPSTVNGMCRGTRHMSWPAEGNTIELFVDADPAIWAEDPSAVATVKPLSLG